MRKGFTLIELLVVIAIIAILAAILFPIFISARNKAHQAACLSNMRQIASAAMIYVDNYNGRLPWVLSPDIGGNNTKTFVAFNATSVGNKRGVLWADKFMPYVKNEGVFKCRASTETQNPPHQTSLQKVCMSYGANAFRDGAGNDYGVFKLFNPDLGGIFSSSQGNQPRTLTEISNTARTIMFGEPASEKEPIPEGGDPSTHYRYVVGPIWITIKSHWPSARHSGGSNVIFCDGHVRWMDQKTLATDLNWWRAVAGQPRQ